MLHHSRIFCITAVTCLALASSASAYVQTRPAGEHQPVRWTQPTIDFVLDVQNLPSSLTEMEALATVKQAAAAWSHPRIPCTSAQITVRASTMTLDGTARDGVNNERFSDDPVLNA
jgi:hypothetical protein